MKHIKNEVGLPFAIRIWCPVEVSAEEKERNLYAVCRSTRWPLAWPWAKPACCWRREHVARDTCCPTRLVPSWHHPSCSASTDGHLCFCQTLRCAAAMLQQPRVPATGQRQAIEIQIKWREVLAQKQALLKILSKHTGHTIQKLDKARNSEGQSALGLGFRSELKSITMQDWQRPLYMQPKDAIEYGIAGEGVYCTIGPDLPPANFMRLWCHGLPPLLPADGVVRPRQTAVVDKIKSAETYDKVCSLPFLLQFLQSASHTGGPEKIV